MGVIGEAGENASVDAEFALVDADLIAPPR
jgi:hypothetical protein